MAGREVLPTLERSSSKRSLSTISQGLSSSPRKLPRIVSLHSSDLRQTDLARAIARRDGRENVPTGSHPHQVLIQVMRKRGCKTESYSFQDIPSFFQKPTPEQLDAYSGDLLRAVREGNVTLLREFLQEGRLLNCCNPFGEHLLHLASRKKLIPVVKFLIQEARVPLNVHDDFGRTPLHDACWTDPPCFEVVDLIIEQCPDLLLIKDKRGHTPLFYARKEHWGVWISHLSERGQTILPRILFQAHVEPEEETDEESYSSSSSELP